MIIAPSTASLQEQEGLAQQLLERRRRLEDELNSSRLEAIRKEEELKNAARQDEEEISAQLRAAGGPPSHLSSFNVNRKRTHDVAQALPTAVTIRTIDAWIFEPFKEETGTADLNTALILMATLPRNNFQFNGDPKQWPMFIQTVKNMVHDITPFNAQRINLVRSMLTEQLQQTFGQILSSPLTYQQALQDLWSWFGRPHLVVQAYIKDLRSIPVLKENDVDALSTFQQRIHGAICSLQAAGYGHELSSSIALATWSRSCPTGWPVNGANMCTSNF